MTPTWTFSTPHRRRTSPTWWSIPGGAGSGCGTWQIFWGFRNSGPLDIWYFPVLVDLLFKFYLTSAGGHYRITFSKPWSYEIPIHRHKFYLFWGGRDVFFLCWDPGYAQHQRCTPRSSQVEQPTPVARSLSDVAAMAAWWNMCGAQVVWMFLTSNHS
jgi:hypothetical protein